MQFQPTQLPDVQLITLQVHRDARGHFMESFRLDQFQAHCGPHQLVQDNHSSSQDGVLRGLHFQLKRPQGKLLQLSRGRIFDVQVDLRRHSPTFGQWQGIWLDSAVPQLLWIPPGFAHGFYVSSGPAEVNYKCSDYYQPDDQYVLRYDDPTLDIPWPDAAHALLSDKDRQGESFAQLQARLL